MPIPFRIIDKLSKKEKKCCTQKQSTKDEFAFRVIQFAKKHL